MRGNNEERGCSQRRRREEGGATWQSSFEIPPQSDIYSISHRQDAVIKMCQTVVRVLLDFSFFLYFFFFFFFVISVAPLGEFQMWNHFSGRWWWEQAAASLPENFTSSPNKQSVKDQSYDK